MKGLGRSAALLGLSGAASLILTLGPGLGVAHALEDDKGDKKDSGLFDDKDRCEDDKGLFDDKDEDRDKDKDDDILGGLFDDKDKDKDRDKDCVGGVGVGVGAVGVGGVGAGGVAAGGGGMSADSVPVAPLVGAGLGAILLGVGVASRRRGQGAS
ncbi:MAG: hypothetical protein IRZ08_10295 [Frankia sp.]|nr:hypothetical protein [Frankia sp.]